MNSALRSLAGKFTHKSWVTLTKRNGHSVRLIALEDLPHGKAYKGDVVSVKAGYARNFLVPKKKAVYATPLNFQKLGIVDPEFETEEERIARMERESSMDQKEEQLLKNSDLLKSYLRNKTVSAFVVYPRNVIRVSECRSELIIIVSTDTIYLPYQNPHTLFYQHCS
jgi:hypothetical protein